ncbi:hypothetical protein U1Q18_003634, partial [Sarracenia purpurea var. burkii]
MRKDYRGFKGYGGHWNFLEKKNRGFLAICLKSLAMEVVGAARRHGGDCARRVGHRGSAERCTGRHSVLDCAWLDGEDGGRLATEGDGDVGIGGRRR